MIRASDIVIRLATVDEILDLRWMVLRAGLPRESANFTGDDAPATHHFAAILQTQVVGCVSFMQSPFEGQPAWQLRGMAVRGDMQGKGVGAILVAFAEKFVRPANHSNIVWCNARVAALRFYQRLGWRIVSEVFEIEHAGPHYKMVKQMPAPVR